MAKKLPTLLLTPEEAFRAVRIKRAKGFQMLASGEIPSIKIGRLRRIPVQALRAWVHQKVSEDLTMAPKDEK